MSNVSELLTLPWIIAEIFGILVLGNGFFIARYFSRFESFAKAVVSLDKTIAILNEKLTNLQINDHEKTKTIAKLIKQLTKLKNAFVKLRTSVEYCQNHCLNKKGESHDQAH